MAASVEVMGCGRLEGRRESRGKFWEDSGSRMSTFMVR